MQTAEELKQRIREIDIELYFEYDDLFGGAFQIDAETLRRERQELVNQLELLAANR